MRIVIAEDSVTAAGGFEPALAEQGLRWSFEAVGDGEALLRAVATDRSRCVCHRRPDAADVHRRGTVAGGAW